MITTKVCPCCKTEKERTRHNYYFNQDGQIRAYCIPCSITKKLASDKLRMPQILARNRIYCKNNPEKVKIWNRNTRVKNYNKRMWKEAKDRAAQRGVPFTITIDDISIPEVCPILGIPLFIGTGCACDNSPSLDAIIPSLGYTKENIAVISHRANSIKNNANIEELRKIADWLEKMILERIFST